MEMDMLHSAGNALLIILDPIRMGYLFGGVWPAWRYCCPSPTT